jgi:hypothetical protein
MTQAPRVRQPVTRFVLQRPAVVRVNVWEQSPTCLFLGRYTFRGDRGANVLVLRKRVGGHRLVIGGTYHLVGAARGANVLDVRVRLARVHDAVRIRRSGLRSVCAAVEGLAFNVLGGFNPSATAPTSIQKPPSQPIVPGHGSAAPSAAGPPPAAGAEPRGPLPASPTSRAVLFVLLALAVALLAGAAVPGPAAAGGAVARHRAVLTSAGITLMVAAALVILLT